jgi:hypothetical protein
MDADRARAAVESATWRLGADDGDRTMAMDATLLLCVVGSTVHGLGRVDRVLAFRFRRSGRGRELERQ